MTTPSTQQQLRGRAVGCLFFSTFGAIWILLALAGSGRFNPLSSLLCLSVWLVQAAASVFILKSVGPIEPSAAQAEEEKKRQRAFKIVNVTQWIAVFVAILLLNVVEKPLFIPTAIVIIVGLHMLPLARTFQYRQHYVTAAALILWAITAALLAPTEHLPPITSFGAGLILWSSSVVTLARSLKRLRYSQTGFAALA